MIFELYIFILLLCLVGSLFCKRNILLETIVLCIIIFLMGRGADTLDTINYKVAYNNSPNIPFSESYEKLYLAIQKLGNLLSLNYIQFRMLLLILSWILIRSTFNKLTNNFFYILFFYIIFGLIIDTVQVRNFIAFSLIIFGSRFLITPSKNGSLKYSLCVIIAANLHISSLIYFIFLIVRRENPKRMIKPIIFITVILCLVIFLFGNKVPFLDQIMLGLESDKLTYYTKGTTTLGFLYPMTFHLLNLTLVYFATIIIKNRTYVRETDFEAKRNVLEYIFWINVISIVFFPLFIYNVQFIRLTRNLILINLLALSLIQRTFVKSNPKLFFLNLSMMFSMGFIYYYTFIIQDHYDDVIVPFFDSNTLEP